MSRVRTRASAWVFACALLCAVPSLGSRAVAEEPPVHIDSDTSGPLQVTISVHPFEAQLGEPIRLTIEAQVEGDDDETKPPRRLAWPDLATLLPDALGESVIEVGPHRRAGHLRTLTAEIVMFDAGEFEFPPLTVALLDGPPGEEPPSVTLAAFKVYVESVLPAVDAEEAPLPVGTRGAVDIPPEALADESTSWPWWVLGVLVALVAGVLLWRRNRKSADVQATITPPPPPPHERALQALQALLSRHLPEQGDVEPYFVELSEILRRYVEDRFGLRAPEQTTEEFLADLQQTAAGRRAIDGAQRAVLREFLGRADLVKFARDEPDVSSCVEAADAARTFVVETSPSVADGADNVGNAASAADADEEQDGPYIEDLIA